MSNKTLIMIPAYNESSTIGRVLDDLANQPYTLLVVDDGSVDETTRKAREKGVRVVRHAINMGLGAAIATGLEVARREGFQVAITFDADGQHNPADIAKLLTELDSYDLVIGSRSICKKRMPFVKKVGNFMLNMMTLVFFGVRCTDSQSGLRAFNRKAIESIRVVSNRYEVSSEILYEARKKGLRIGEVPVEVIYTDYSVGKGTSLADGFKILWRIILHKPGGDMR
ncbi:glycosyltransferase family 2 protein [Candidatus Altiarchaeota archaeon]